MRIVLDTNLLVSGVIAAGLPRRLLDGAKAGEFELCTSEALLMELLVFLQASLQRSQEQNQITLEVRWAPLWETPHP